MPTNTAFKILRASSLLAMCLLGPGAGLSAQSPLRVFISVDMEGIGGVGTPAMTGAGGKDYATARELMTAEVNTVVAAILERGPAEIVVNDSHGDHQNVLHTQLDPRVVYIQGALKPLGMMQGITREHNAVIFIGYHTRAGAEGGFLAHTGSGVVKGLWINGVEVGEGGMNAYYAGSLGVPVILASGDSAFTLEIAELTGTRTVSTKVAVGSSAARLLHPDVVRRRLADATRAALDALPSARPLRPSEPVTVRLRFDATTRADIVLVIPGVRRVDGYTVEYQSATMAEAYALIRLMYRYVDW